MIEPTDSDNEQYGAWCESADQTWSYNGLLAWCAGRYTVPIEPSADVIAAGIEALTPKLGEVVGQRCDRLDRACRAMYEAMRPK